MDEIDTFKVKALDNLAKTIDALSTEIDKSQAYVDRVRAGETAAQQTSDLDLPTR